MYLILLERKLSKPSAASTAAGTDEALVHELAETRQEVHRAHLDLDECTVEHRRNVRCQLRLRKIHSKYEKLESLTRDTKILAPEQVSLNVTLLRRLIGTCFCAATKFLAILFELMF